MTEDVSGTINDPRLTDPSSDEDEPLLIPQSLLSSKDPNFYSIHEEGTSSFATIFSVVSTTAGAGVLGLPFAVAQSGWSGIFLLILTSFMANYTGKILIKSMYARKPHLKLRTYHHVGEAAFGKAGLYLTLAFQNATLIAVGTLFLILAGVNAESLIEVWSNRDFPISLYIGGTAVLVWPFIIGLKTMKEISWVAIAGMIATTLSVLLALIGAGLHPAQEKSHTWVNVKEYAYAFSTFVFAFGGHNVFPTIQDSMQKTKTFNKMFNYSFVMIMLIYLPPCIVGYYYFGDTLQSPILGNLQNGILKDLSVILITLHIVVTIPIIDNPVNLWLEDVLKVEEKKSAFLWRSLSRTILLLIQAGIAIGLPHFGDIMALIGATIVSATTFTLPCLIYLKFYWKKVSSLELAWICLVLLFATLGSSIGLYTAVLNLISDVSNHDYSASIPDYVFYVIVAGSTLIGFVLILFSLYKISLHHKRETALRSTSPFN